MSHAGQRPAWPPRRAVSGLDGGGMPVEFPPGRVELRLGDLGESSLFRGGSGFRCLDREPV